MADTTPTMPSEEIAEFQAECQTAFNEMFALARRLKPKGESAETAREYSKGLAKIGAAHGFTKEETLRYGVRIWAMIRNEAQA